MIGEWEQRKGRGPNPWPQLVVVLKNQEKKPGTEQPVTYICFGKGHRQSGWCKSMETWVSLSPLHHQTPPMLTIALMVAQHLHLSCFAKWTSCHHFSVRPEISPCTALENWVLHNMSCTPRKRKEKNINNQTFKTKAIKNQLNNQTFPKETAMENQPNWKKIAPLWGGDLVFKIRCCAGK